MARKKEMFAVIDTETAGTIEAPLVYDLAVAICDRDGTIYQKQRWIIKEVMGDKALMDTAYYAEKIPTFYQGLEGITVPLGVAIKQLRDILNNHNVKTVSAYNLPFDLRALANTYMVYIGKPYKRRMIWTQTNEGKFFPDWTTIFLQYVLRGEARLLCIWSFACEVLYSKKQFAKFAIANGFYSEKGNLQTNAEVGYKFLTGELEFVEEHTALADVEIEVEILAKCYSKKEKHESGILFNPWRIAQKFNTLQKKGKENFDNSDLE
jgi:hypothetical protein